VLCDRWGRKVFLVYIKSGFFIENVYSGNVSSVQKQNHLSAKKKKVVHEEDVAVCAVSSCLECKPQEIFRETLAKNKTLSRCLLFSLFNGTLLDIDDACMGYVK